MIMLLSELLNEETLDEYKKRLVKSLGISKLGAGAFGTVFSHPAYHNVAVKVFQWDPEYVKFAKFCKANPNNRWLPKVIDVVTANVDSGGYEKYGQKEKREINIVFFQKLRSATRAEIKAAVHEILSEIPEEEGDDRFNPKKSKNKKWYHDKSNFDDIGMFEWNLVIKHTKDKDLKQFATWLYNADYGTDLHNANVMMRDEGDRSQLVFTDPVAS